MKRALVHFSGRVQGVGFRYSCRSVAKGFSLTGYVKNLDDGRVEMVAEGEKEEIEEFLKAIKESHLGSFIREATLDWLKPTAEWRDFHIEH
jgi:acylphosphatase